MSKKVLICNERLLFRFGVDRILLTLAEELTNRGMDVLLLCLRADKQVRQTFKGRVIELEEINGQGLVDAEYLCSSHLRQLLSQSAHTQRFDLIVSGGWPFFTAAIAGRQHGIPTVFLDAGSVPHNGLHGDARAIQMLLRKIRSLSLPHFTRVIAISEFIRHSQSLPDRGHADGVQTVHLGVDHLDRGVFAASNRSDEASILKRLQDQQTAGMKLVLNLGRFEPTGYKNSPAGIRITRQAAAPGRKIRLVILEDRAELVKALGFGGLTCIEAVGKVSDQTLVDIMKLVDAGLSVSLWEGFNLPLGEMQRLGKPVLAYHIGAHAEVVSHPWCLALSEPELARKLSIILDGGLPVDVKQAISDWRNKKQFTWEAAIDAYIAAFDEMLADAHKHIRYTSPKSVLVDVTNASVDEANSGVMRVTRRLLRELQQHSNVSLIFVRWNDQTKTYELLNRAHAQILATFGGPHDTWSLAEGLPQGRPLDMLEVDLLLGSIASPILFMPEIALDGSATMRMAWASSRNIQVSVILHDLIPITHPQFCDASIVKEFPAYLGSVLNSGLIAANSGETLKQLEAYLVRENLQTSSVRKAVWLPGQFSDFPRVQRHQAETRKSANEFEIVCISTIEPRKNQLRLIEAFKQVRQQYDHKKIKLILIGNSYAGRPDYQAQFLAAITDDPSIEWRGKVSDADAAAAIERARFTVYASVVEGFGLPILESLWLGTPCLCHSAGVMNELANDGGCLTVNMENPAEISAGLQRLLNDTELVARLAREALNRPITTWAEYANQMGSAALGLSGPDFTHSTHLDGSALSRQVDVRITALARKLNTIRQFEEFVSPITLQHEIAKMADLRRTSIKSKITYLTKFIFSSYSWRSIRKWLFNFRS